MRFRQKQEDNYCTHCYGTGVVRSIVRDKNDPKNGKVVERPCPYCSQRSQGRKR